MDMNDIRLTEPFFQQTVARLRAIQPAPAERFTEFEALVRLEKISDSLKPAGFIFHSSRCGSTLLANICRVLEDSVVISEAAAVDKLAARFITDANSKVKELLYSVFLRGAVSALAQRRTGKERRFFIKFSCCSTAQMNRIKRIWPDVPQVFMYREPTETIVSNLANVPEWLTDNDHRIMASILGATEGAISAMKPAELCSRAIGSFYSSALGLTNDNCLLLNYNQLSVELLLGVLKFFKITPTAAEREAIACCNTVYSKDASFVREFVPDAAAKQSQASDIVRELSKRWAAEPYRLLEQRRSQTAGDLVSTPS
jgi:hypothetical protein